jgi:LynF/TruF/PatF family peptide O-prenyltransferase
MNKAEENLKKYINHRKIFQIPDSDELEIFEQFFKPLRDCDLERSLKIEKNEVYACRFDLWFSNVDFKSCVLQILFFFHCIQEKLKVKFDLSLFNKIYLEHFDQTKINQIILGIDLRENRIDSRLKIWIIVKNDINTIRQVLELHGYNTNVLNLITKTELLFGFDFVFDGTTKIKIYPAFLQSEINNSNIHRKLENNFSSKTIHLMELSQMAYISFKGVHFKKVIHFFLPENKTIFIRQLNSSVFNAYYQKYQDTVFLHENIVSFFEDEIETGLISNFNIYY